MRLAVCALSAVLLSGCSWLGIGGNKSGSYGNHGAAGAYGCMPGGQWGGGNQYGYQGHHGQGAGCGPAGGYAVAGNGYGGAGGMGGYGAGSGAYGAGAGGYGAGMGGYGAGAGGYGAGMGGGAYGAGAGGAGLRGAQTMGGYGYGAGGAGTVLGANAPYGSAVGGQYASGGSSSYQTVQGAPIYVPQPYPAYYGAPAGGGNFGYGGCGNGGGFGCGLRGGAALPFGFEAGIGTDFSIDGDVFPGEAAKPFLAGPGTVSELAPVSYKDAFDETVHYDLAATYDLDPSTTLLGRIGYSEADGQSMLVGTVDDGAGLTEDLTAQFSDLEQVTLEGGVRRYMGGWNNRFSGVRPYVGATAGFTHNNSVDLTQSSATLVDPTLFTQEYIQAGWTPTASGVVGAEMQVGARTALGVETGIRWSDDLNTNFDTGDRWSVPVRLRGRVSF